jgi:GDP/UDP-N,N'-diacetylbacillosamine 2-epimerase (hydrolysing)
MKKKNIKYNIIAVTTNRADYGLLREILIKINNDKEFNLTILAAGNHNDSKFGNTYLEIQKDKFKRIKKININFKSNFKKDIIKNIIDTIKSTNYFFEKKIDLLILLGDRYEIFCYAFAAHILNIPIAHFNGGEVTSGSIDDAFRHSISKFSQIHFVSNKVYKKRIIQLGESPKSVYITGEIGLENVKNFKFINKNSLFDLLKLDKNKKTILITYHNETLEHFSIYKLNVLLKSVKKFNNFNLVFTGSNADYGGQKINNQIKKFVKNNNNAFFFNSLGRKKYISLLKYSDLVLGNSSSGIVEAPSLQVPSINLGNRQKGRLAAKSVIHCDYKLTNLKEKIKKCVYGKMSSKNFRNPYELKGGINLAVKVIKKKLKKKINLNKIFYDL